MEPTMSYKVKSARLCKRYINSRIQQINTLLDQLKSIKAILDRSVSTPLIISLYNQYKGKSCVQSVKVGESSVATEPCFEPSTDKSPQGKLSKQEVKMISDNGFIEYIMKSREYKDNQNDVKTFVTTVHSYRKNLALMAHHYSSLLEHVTFLSSVSKKN